MNIRIHYLLLLAANLLSLVVSAQYLTISASKNKAIGTSVTVRGVVTNGSELGKIRFLQDETAGIAVFAGDGSIANFSQHVKKGDSIEVTGVLTESNGLMEINPVTGYNIYASNKKLPEPKDISAHQFSEQYEGQLVRIRCATFSDQGNFYADSYGFTASVGLQASMYVNDGNPLYDALIPSQSVTITGILSQYNEYQILPRGIDDIKDIQCFHYNTLPSTNVSGEKIISIQWKTNKPSSGALYLSDKPDEKGEFLRKASSQDLEHQQSIEGLQEGKIYYLRVISVHGKDTISSPVITFSLSNNSTGYADPQKNLTEEKKDEPSKIPNNQTVSQAFLLPEYLRRRYLIMQS